MKNNTDKRTKLSQREYKRHHDARSARKTLFPISQLEYVYRPFLSTSTADAMAGVAHSSLRHRSLGLYLVMSTTTHSITIQLDRALNIISADGASLTTVKMQLQDDIVDNERHQVFLETLVKTRGKGKNSQAKRRYWKSNKQVFSLSHFQTSQKLPGKGGMSCNSMDILHLTIRRTRHRTPGNTFKVRIGKKFGKVKLYCAESAKSILKSLTSSQTNHESVLAAHCQEGPSV